jgi:hypothetical protein
MRLIVFCISLFTLTGCVETIEKEPGVFGKNLENENSNSFLEHSVAILKDKTMFFSVEEKNNGVVELYLNNPKNESIQSLKTVILYPTKKIKIKRINNKAQSIFSLTVPPEWKINKDNGVINIGMSSTKNNKIDKKLLIATISVEYLYQGEIPISIDLQNSNIFKSNKDNEVHTIFDKIKNTEPIIINK